MQALASRLLKFAASLHRELTVRRVVYAAIFLIAAWAFAQVFSIDPVVLMAGDVAFYVEVASLFYLAIARNQIGYAYALLLNKARQQLRLARNGHMRARVRARRARKTASLPKPKSDEPAAAWGYAFA